MTDQEKLKCMDLIDELRGDEGSLVSIACDNADFNGLPDRAVFCCGEWTGWAEQDFRADTLLECLEAAASAFRASKQKAKGETT